VYFRELDHHVFCFVWDTALICGCTTTVLVGIVVPAAGDSGRAESRAGEDGCGGGDGGGRDLAKMTMAVDA